MLLSTGAAFLTVVVNYYAPAKVFKISDRQLRRYRPAGLFSHRRFTIADAQNSAEQKEAKFACGCGFIRGSRLVIGFITFVLVVMLFRPAQQLEVLSTGLLAIGIICTVPIMARWKKADNVAKTPIHNTR